jgi:hypothetical protein
MAGVFEVKNTCVGRLTSCNINRGVCLTEEESSMLMSLLSKKYSHVWMGGGKRECLGPGKELSRVGK